MKTKLITISLVTFSLIFTPFVNHFIYLANAQVESVLMISPTSVEFGTVFPQEYLEKTAKIALSESFIKEWEVNNVEYKIIRKPKCKVWEGGECKEYYNDLCPFLSQLSDRTPNNDEDVPSYYDPQGCLDTAQKQAQGYLNKAQGDYEDNWTIDLKVPPFAGYVGQDWPAGCPIVPKEGDYACDLWIEVKNISENKITKTLENLVIGTAKAFEAHIISVTARICNYSQTRTMGYWKNHEIVYLPHLPQTLGNDNISNISEATAVFDAANVEEMKNMLKAQLLAMKFNIAHFGIGEYVVESEGKNLNEIVAAADELLKQEPEPSKEVLEVMRDLLNNLNNLHLIKYCSNGNLEPVCAIKLQRDGVEIDEINVGETFDIYYGDSADDTGISEVRFSSDDEQNGIPAGEWTDWAFSGDPTGQTKTKAWSFATTGNKEVWAEIKDDIGQTTKCSVNISATIPENQPPDKPSNLSPYDGEINVSLTPTLKSSPFSDPDGDIHQATSWQITTVSGDYSSPSLVFNGGTYGVSPGIDPSILTQIEIPEGTLQYGTTYYWRVAYSDSPDAKSKSEGGSWSDWSDETSFITENRSNQPPKPTNIFPENGASDINLVVTLESSLPFQSDAIVSQWQITTIPGNYSNPIFDKIGDDERSGVNYTILPEGILNYNTTYYWHTRYRNSDGVWSDWSDEASFTTFSPSIEYSPANPFTNEEISFRLDFSLPPGATCEWDFGKETVITEECWRRATHIYSQEGEYSVNLEITDRDANKYPIVTSIEVSKEELILRLIPSNSFPKKAEEIILDASNSYNTNPRREIVSYKWEILKISDNNKEMRSEGITATPKIFYYWEEEGTYIVTLEITDDKGNQDITGELVEVKPLGILERFQDPPWKKRTDNIPTKDELEHFKSKLNIDEDNRFSELTNAQLAVVLNTPVSNEKIIKGGIPEEAKEAAIAFTYGRQIAGKLGEMEEIDDILSGRAETKLADKIDEILPYLAVLKTVKSIADTMIKGGFSLLFEALRLEWVGAIIKGVNGVEEFVGIGNPIIWMQEQVPTLEFWGEIQHYASFRGYLLLRKDGKLHAEAWNEIIPKEGKCPLIDDHPDYCLLAYGATINCCLFFAKEDEFAYYEENYRKIFEGDENFEGYGLFIEKTGLNEDFKKQVKESLKEDLFIALEQYKFEPLYKKVTLSSPGELRVYDSQERITGLVNGEVKEEIPRSIYDAENKTVILFNLSEVYRYEVVGTEKGTYGLDITSVENGETTTFTATDTPTSDDTIHQYTIDWDALSQGEKGVTLQIDADGDGVFEETVTADNDLTYDEFILQTETIIDFDPDTLNLLDKGKFVTTYIELPEGYEVSQIDISSIMLNDLVQALTKPTEIGDYDKDNIPDLMVKFDRSKVRTILSPGNEVPIAITGKVFHNGIYIDFKGSDIIRVIDSSKGKI